jgi:hypothetical protein
MTSRQTLLAVYGNGVPAPTRQSDSAGGDLLPPIVPPGSPKSRVINHPIDIDLGELIEGQHVVLKGVEVSEFSNSVVHNDFLPGFSESRGSRLDTSWGLGEIVHDLGTKYEHGGQGGWASDPDGMVRWGDESLGGVIPKRATKLSISFRHANSWLPRDRWVARVDLDLHNWNVVGVTWGEGTDHPAT